MRSRYLAESSERSRHQLVLTWPVVLELAAPLVSPAATTVVKRLLKDLETLPLTYIHGQIISQEIRAAITARRGGCEYSPINAYVSRLDDAITAFGRVPTSIYLNHSLAETVFTIWQAAPDVFQWQRDKIPLLEAALELDRCIEDPPRPPEHFRSVIRKQGIGRLAGKGGCVEIPSGRDRRRTRRSAALNS